MKLRSPLEFGSLARGGRQARTDLPSGIRFRRNARNERRGNRFNQSLKEFFLVVCGDPQVSAPWLAQQIKKLETQGFDATRQRAGARFDSNHGPLLVPLARPFFTAFRPVHQNSTAAAAAAAEATTASRGAVLPAKLACCH
jgi:hypothetical protein